MHAINHANLQTNDQKLVHFCACDISYREILHMFCMSDVYTVWACETNALTTHLLPGRQIPIRPSPPLPPPDLFVRWAALPPPLSAPPPPPLLSPSAQPLSSSDLSPKHSTQVAVSKSEVLTVVHIGRNVEFKCGNAGKNAWENFDLSVEGACNLHMHFITSIISCKYFV